MECLDSSPTGGDCFEGLGVAWQVISNKCSQGVSLPHIPQPSTDGRSQLAYLARVRVLQHFQPVLDADPEAGMLGQGDLLLFRTLQKPSWRGDANFEDHEFYEAGICSGLP